MTRAEFDALVASVADLRAEVRDLAKLVRAAIDTTNCTDERSVRLDGLLRDWMTQRLTPEGQAFDTALREMLAEWQHARARRDDARQWWVDLGVKTGVYSAVFGLAAGFVSGAAWVVLTALRWVNGGVP